MDIVIKKSDEAEKAYGIAQKLPDYFNEKGLKSIKEDVKTQFLYGAYKNGEMVGFITYKELNPEAIEITWTAVLPDTQGEGVGSKLVLESLQQLGDNYKVCEVKTLSDTHPDTGYKRTREFYKRLGFIPLETIYSYPGWDEKNPCQIFVKFLNW
jgi:ribosomal protein S18 acetylase RimI-like enzyme